MGKWGLLTRWERDVEVREAETVSKKRCGSGRGFDGEPRRTLCTELREADAVVPAEAWAVHGEFDEAEPDNGMDTGVFGQIKHVELENLTEEDIYPDRDDFLVEEEREANRDPEWNPKAVAQAGANLMIALNLNNPTRAMCNVVAAYMGQTECRMDGVIHHCLNCKNDGDVVEAAVEFAGKMERYFPEISPKAKKRLITDAQIELQRQRRTDGPAYRLGKAIYNSHWSRFLRATV